MADDGALVPAVHRFEDAVSGLIDPQREIVDGRTYYLDSLYSELSDSLAGCQGHAGNLQPRSLPMLWLDAFECLTNIDQTVAKWPLGTSNNGLDPRSPATVTRLQALSDAKYRPQDTDMLTDRSAQLEGFAVRIKGLLLPEITIPLYGHRCPICNQAEVRRSDVTGAAMTLPTLLIKGDSALCQACKAVWEYSRLPMLGRMLGVQPTAMIGEGS